METLTTKEAAARLGVTVPRIHALIRTGRLPAEKRGRDVFINEPDLKLVENRKPGRPPKVKAEVSTVVEKPKRATKKGGRK
jgi:excisionase family DNA binding protein